MSDYLSIILSGLILLTSGIFAKSENACQKDYYFAADIKITPSVTATPDDDDDGDDDTLTPTVTPTPEDIEIETPTQTPTDVTNGTPSPTPEVTPAAQQPFARSGREIFSDIEKSSEKRKVEAAIRGNVDLSSDASGNWLGKQSEGDGAFKDSDGDGYTDAFESLEGTELGDSKSFPPVLVKTNIKELLLDDSDMDGLSSTDETALEISSSKFDSDGDGCGDGSEVLSFSDPKNGESFPAPDADRDCLSNEFEKKWRLRADLADTDGDKLSDAKEVALGTNPFSIDTDGDGIVDGKEVSLSSNPLKSG